MYYMLLTKREAEFKKIKSLASALGNQGLDLLSKMLKFNPKDRISCQEALQHEFFAEIVNS